MNNYAEDINTINYEKRPFKIKIKLRSFVWTTKLIFKKFKINTFGHSGDARGFVRLKPIITESLYDTTKQELATESNIINDKNEYKNNKQTAKIVPFNDIKRRRLFSFSRSKKIHVKRFILPRIEVPNIIPFAKVFSKFILMFSISLLLISLIVWLFSDLIIKYIVNEYGSFQKKQSIHLIDVETTPLRSNIEDFNERIMVVEEVLKIHQHPELRPRKKPVRRYKVMNRGTNHPKYIIR